MKILSTIIKFICSTIFIAISFLAVIFVLTIFFPNEVQNAVEIFKNFFNFVS